ncbi:MAG: motility associated factor glycosyltransferase family protein [Aliarcobacter sp.]|nr:motility associated factor glycosyltransferase family protein [Aliarcobacter sp.]
MITEEQLQDALTTTFLANLVFLQEYDNELFQRIDGLSKKIQKEEYKERYRLEFNKDEGDFDIYDINHDIFLYDKKPRQKNIKTLSEINFDTKGSFSILEPFYFADNNKIEVNDNNTIFEINGRKLIDDINEFKSILKDNLSTYIEQKVKNIDKFMFIGTLLGRHIPLIISKIKAKNFFICEDNLEIFRLSLFVVDYSILARDGNTVVFSIMEEKFIFNIKCSTFLSNDYHQNYIIKYYTTNYNVKSYFDDIMDSLISEKSIIFNHYMMLDNVAKLALSRIKNYNILSRNLAKDINLLIKNKPVLYIGAGPSLSDNIKWISDNKEKFIIVSIGAACKKLISENIIPDIIVTLDPQYEILRKAHFDDGVIDKIKDKIIFSSMNTDERILNKFNQGSLFLYEVIFSIDFKERTEKGYSVGEIGATLFLNLGVENLYLIGLDLALNQDTGHTHVSGYNDSTTHNLEKIISSMDKNFFTLRGDVIKVKGNFKESVYTTRLFNTSLNAFSQNCEMLKKKEQTIYNLSKSGAYINSTLPLDIEDFNTNNFEVLDKILLAKGLKENFYKISNKFDQSSYTDLNKEKEYLLGVKEFIEDDLIMIIDSFESFSKRYLIIEKALLSPDIKTTFTTMIFAFYFRSVIPYLYYHFNNRKIKNENKKIEKINKVMNNQLVKLIDRYITYINYVLKD